MSATREQWLGHLVDALRPAFAALGHALPARIRVSCGWPSRGGMSRSRKVLGQAWSAECSEDGAHETFLSPCMGDAAEVAHVLVHELVHHAVGHKCGHRGPFRKLALALGLEGQMTATVPGAALKERLHALCEPLGPYPHAALNPLLREKKQSTRMLRVSCVDCGCIVRMSRQSIDGAGLPTCGCGGQMRESCA